MPETELPEDIKDLINQYKRIIVKKGNIKKVRDKDGIVKLQGATGMGILAGEARKERQRLVKAYRRQGDKAIAEAL